MVELELRIAEVSIKCILYMKKLGEIRHFNLARRNQTMQFIGKFWSLDTHGESDGRGGSMVSLSNSYTHTCL